MKKAPKIRAWAVVAPLGSIVSVHTRKADAVAGCRPWFLGDKENLDRMSLHVVPLAPIKEIAKEMRERCALGVGRWVGNYLSIDKADALAIGYAVRRVRLPR